MNNIIDQGIIATVDGELSLSLIPWNKHATCEGVFLKHLIKGEQTGGKFSCHLVKVQAGCQISDHIHPENWELHEVVSGEAIGIIENRQISYEPGTCAVIPQGKIHRVVAGDQDLYIMAKFIPALL
ncbi:cupin domain-containing protein [Leptolinea tardivitalis]|uniref:Cupin type-2 domain-containing protein n=1 Tax=Leptolinea tardivitalis TaxID=229920 RepID=A0A0P6X1W5_9CHLR|nr:cupin domain-containing protein [Leptolinea tardivitalis]KPL73412.1 hypothetical protein ADM99_04230 [Leptolinea tardivitalis]GAP21569.1 cupin domain [Leptolinea tardivitalis]